MSLRILYHEDELREHRKNHWRFKGKYLMSSFQEQKKWNKSITMKQMVETVSQMAENFKTCLEEWFFNNMDDLTLRIISIEKRKENTFRITFHPNLPCRKKYGIKGFYITLPYDLNTDFHRRERDKDYVIELFIVNENNIPLQYDPLGYSVHHDKRYSYCKIFNNFENKLENLISYELNKIVQLK